MGVAIDREAPFYFTKAAEHYVPTGSTVAYPLGTSNYHYEMELVAVFGAPAFRVRADGALACVFGYTCGLDMTRRDQQFAAREQKRPWDLGKQQSDLSLLIHSVPDIVAHLSTFYHLQPGDDLHGDYTGTPEGGGPVKPGDKITGAIAGVGTIAAHERPTGVTPTYTRSGSAPTFRSA